MTREDPQRANTEGYKESSANFIQSQTHQKSQSQEAMEGCISSFKSK